MVCDRLQHVDSERIVCVFIITVIFILASKLTIVRIIVHSHLDSYLRRETQRTLIVDILGVKDAIIFVRSFA